MNLVILHYHLNRGGVTQVAANHLHALSSVGAINEIEQIILLHGGRHEGTAAGVFEQAAGRDVLTIAMPELDYEGAQDAKQLAARLQSHQLTEHGCPAESTLLHVHNHSLGKNVALPGALWLLAAGGYRLLLQIHDFAEDFRPDNYRNIVAGLAAHERSDVPTHLYPQAEHVHYAALNGRDFGLLDAIGVPSAQLHKLPNPVSPLGELPDRDAARATLQTRFGVPPEEPLFLYPVRGIRRKNLGEFLLWAALAGVRATFALTLAPLNPAEAKSYNRWVDLANELQLPCVFDSGGEEGLGFTENLAAADCLITTSVAEGFGMVFLETWPAGRPLVGRDLPEITADFTAAGMRLDGLRDRLAIPLEWVGAERFRVAITDTFAQARADYGLGPADVAELKRQFSEIVAGQEVDFALLPSTLQEEVVRRVHADDTARAELLRRNPWIESALATRTQSETSALQANAEVVQNDYSLEVSGRRLATLYKAVMASPTDAALVAPAAGHRILDSFLSLARLHSIRLEP